MRVGLLLLLATVLALLLAGCADRQARNENRALALRVTQLETQLKAIQAQQAPAEQGGSAAQITRRAAAGYCASELARDLESYNQDNGRYPPASAVSLPSACADFQVAWSRLTAGGYAFAVRDRAGGVLAREGR